MSGALFVISGPSGVGKSTVAERMLQIDDSLTRIVTCTTRSIRSTERHGVDYFFLDHSEFSSKIQKNEFIEFSEVYGNYYGILFSTISDQIKEKNKAIAVINWKGFEKVKNAFRDNVFGIFVNPPSMGALEDRIKKRNTDSAEVINARLQLAQEDMRHACMYDKCVVNHDVEKTALEILEYIREHS